MQTIKTHDLKLIKKGKEKENSRFNGERLIMWHKLILMVVD